MPRTKGAVNLLVRIDTPNGKFYFPRLWWASLEQRGADYKTRTAVATAWAETMMQYGYTAEWVNENRETIHNDSDARIAIKEALSTHAPSYISASAQSNTTPNGVAHNAANQPQQTSTPDDHVPDYEVTADDETPDNRAACRRAARAAGPQAPAIIKNVAPKFPYGTALFDQLIDFANEVRAKQAKDPDNTRYTMSMRTIIKIVEDISYCGVPLTQAIKDNVLSVVNLIDLEEYNAIVTLANSRFVPDDKKIIEALELTAVGPALPSVLPDGVPVRSFPFQTDEHYFHGLLRKHPADADRPRMHGTFVDGDPGLVFMARRFAVGRRPLAFVGPAGCGKTEFAKYLAFESGLRAHIQSHDAHMEVEDVIGKWDIGANGVPVFTDGPLTDYVANGGVYIADEETTVRAGVGMVYQEVKNGGDLSVRTAAGIRVVERNPNFRFIGTFNPWTSYVGSNEMNLAQIERSYVSQWKYADKAKEKKILEANFPQFAGVA